MATSRKRCVRPTRRCTPTSGAGRGSASLSYPPARVRRDWETDEVTGARLDLNRNQILAYRRSVGPLNVRLPAGAESLRHAAWAGLQDSMPRAALLAIHARVEGTTPSTWEDPSLVQLWGPRFSTYVVAARDLAVFSLGRYPDDAKGQQVAEDLAARLKTLLRGSATMTYAEAGRAL